jgi:hypothetical protein
MKNVALALVILAFANVAFASKEGILPLTNFRLESAGIGSSGKIVIEGTQNDDSQLADLKVTAFGKHYVMPKSQLKGLSDLMTNGVRISYEDGYAELGGRTIYIQLQFGWHSATEKEVLITLTENGKFELSRQKGK